MPDLWSINYNRKISVKMIYTIGKMQTSCPCLVMQPTKKFSKTCCMALINSQRCISSQIFFVRIGQLPLRIRTGLLNWTKVCVASFREEGWGINMRSVGISEEGRFNTNESLWSKSLSAVHETLSNYVSSSFNG